jgi:hypothetical protein
MYKYIYNQIKRLLMNDFQVVQTIKCLKNIMVFYQLKMVI